MKTALIAGSTGLVGKELLKLLLESSKYSKVIALTRQDLTVQNPKLIQVKTELPALKQSLGDLKADDVFCCLGTTMAKAGSKEKFYEVDYTYPLTLAKISKAGGSKQFHLVSAMGADKRSNIFYNRVKGEIEEMISKEGFNILHIYRPSLLLGSRTESRPGESAAKVFMGLFGFLVPQKYKGIRASKVAKAMLYFTDADEKGIFIHPSDELRQLNLPAHAN
jgi:uncharacterized protein YbjT (DUF2867 family)